MKQYTRTNRLYSQKEAHKLKANSYIHMTNEHAGQGVHMKH